VSLEKSKNPRDVIIAPVVSEKSYACMDRGQYTFIVAPGSNKTEIKQAVEAIFDVKVSSVNTINRKGKTHRTRTGAQTLVRIRSQHSYGALMHDTFISVHTTLTTGHARQLDKPVRQALSHMKHQASIDEIPKQFYRRGLALKKNVR